MPNQSNFRSNITNNTDSRFLASRIVSFPEEGVLLQEIPASFGFEIYDNIEVHFYTTSGNQLILSTIISVQDTDILKSHVVSYADGTFKNYIRIDFTTLFKKNQLVLVPGDYKMVLNFFSDEIGSYADRSLYLQEISPSQTEVQLAFIDNSNEIKVLENENSLKEFLTKSFDKPTAVGVAEKIFVSGVELNSSTEGLTYENIVDNIAVPEDGQTFDNTIARINRLGEQSQEEFKNAVNNFLPKVFESIREEIIIKGDRRIQEDEFRKFIEDSVNSSLAQLRATTNIRINLS